jgi:hypothetical protein
MFLAAFFVLLSLAVVLAAFAPFSSASASSSFCRANWATSSCVSSWRCFISTFTIMSSISRLNCATMSARNLYSIMVFLFSRSSICRVYSATMSFSSKSVAFSSSHFTRRITTSLLCVAISTSVRFRSAWISLCRASQSFSFAVQSSICAVSSLTWVAMSLSSWSTTSSFPWLFSICTTQPSCSSFTLRRSLKSASCSLRMPE